MTCPYVVADGYVLEHVGCAFEPDEVVVLVDPVERFRVILELVGAEPAGRMVERIDRGTRADRPEGANGRARNEAALVHAKILTHNDVGTDLRILVEEQWTANGRLDDPSTGVEPHDAVKECGFAASIFEEINRDVGERHVSVGVSADRRTSTQISRPFLLMVSRKEIIRLTGMQQRPRKGCQCKFNPAKVAMRRKIRSDSRDSD